jgi:hypothetical protein
MMPGFARLLTPSRRWDVINFIRARAAGDLSRQVGPKVLTAAAYPVPDFAFEKAPDAMSAALRHNKGPVLLVLFAPPAPAAPRLKAAGLRVIAVGLGPLSQNSSEGEPAPFVVGVSPQVIGPLSLFRVSDDGGESELMLDRNGDVRVRWTSNMPDGLAPPGTLVADAEQVARIPVAAPSHAGHAH